MSYRSNLIVTYLLKNSSLTLFSKSSRSIYFHFKGLSFRYSDHRSSSPRKDQIQVIRKASGVWILLPGEKEYIYRSEKSGLYVLRRLIRVSERPSKDYKMGSLEKYKKWKSWDKENRKIKKYLHEILGMSIKKLPSDIP